MTVDITFTITTRSGKLGNGILEWNAENLTAAAVSGPFEKGCLPVGTYVARRSKLVDDCDPPGGTGNSFMDRKGKCWFQAIEAKVDVGRTGLGIHPDGNVAGTEGCIGLTEEDTSPWYNALRRVKGSILVEVKESRSISPFATASDPADYRVEAALNAELEKQRWAVLLPVASASLMFWRDHLKFKTGDTKRDLDQAETGLLMRIVRAVSWVESKHGHAGKNQPERDPVQTGNPQDSWWRTLTGQLGRGDRLVGGEGAPNYWADELLEAMEKVQGVPTRARRSHLGAQLIDGHNNPKFSPEMSFFWGTIYLFHRTNTPTYYFKTVGEKYLVDGAVEYNGGGDKDYRSRIEDALKMIP